MDDDYWEDDLYGVDDGEGELKMDFRDRERFGGQVALPEDLKKIDQRFKDPKERFEAKLFAIFDEPIFPEIALERRRRIVAVIMNLPNFERLNPHLAIASVLLYQDVGEAPPTKEQLAAHVKKYKEISSFASDFLRYYYFIRGG